MATIRNKYTKFQTNYNTDNNNVIIGKSCAKIFDQTSGSHTNNCNNNTHNNSQTNGCSARPQLRWSQSFSPNDRQKPNVSTRKTCFLSIDLFLFSFFAKLIEKTFKPFFS